MDGQAITDNKPTTDAKTPVNEVAEATGTAQKDIVAEVVAKISEAQNILIALSSDPSVDEMSAAIGLSLYLDKLGKRATAIYSGTTPNALEFLKPEEAFESSIDALQDFVIALNKDKADHLRYKLDGDYVKIFITPYRTRISENDLDYSYGDFNIDLVLALNVANGIDLDSALREHGRIMHDAVIINITTGNPGKFGEIEWNDKDSSSISEMIAKMLFSVNSQTKIEKDEATAFLTGIIAATDRFSNAKTASSTMITASRLMESGADQQLIAKNISSEVENNLYPLISKQKAETTDATNLSIEHEDEPKTKTDEPTDPKASEAKAPEAPTPETPLATASAKDENPVEENKETPVADDQPSEQPNIEDDTLLDDLKAAEATLTHAGAETTPESVEAPLKIDSENATDPDLYSSPATPLPPSGILDTPEQAPVDGPNPPAEPIPASEGFINDKSEKVLQPSDELAEQVPVQNANKFGQMLEDALAGTEPIGQTDPLVSPDTNPAISSTPTVPSAPEINGVPEINYSPFTADDILPPPPAPPISSSPLPEPVSEETPEPISAPMAPVPTPSVESKSEPTMPVTENDQPLDPGAFKIPGM